MTVMYGTGEYPGWDDNSLSKPSQTLFKKNGGNMATISGGGCGVVMNDVVVDQLDYESATLQWGNGAWPQNNGTYFAINLNGDLSNTAGGWFFFIDTISFENVSTNSVAILRLRLDKWGTCVANLPSDFKTGTTQVLATNKELNLYDFGSKAYNNLSSFTGLTKVYPNLADIKLIKYSYNQGTYAEQSSNQNNEGFNDGGYYYLYKIIYMVTGVAGTSGSNTYEKIEGGIHDVYTVHVSNGNSNPNPTYDCQLGSWGKDNLGSLVGFAPVVPYNASGSPKDNTIFGKGNLQTVFTFASDKDIGLVQLPFCLSNKGLPQLEEMYLTSNYFLYNNSTFKVGDNSYSLGGSNNGGDVGSIGQCYNVDVNGVMIDDFYLADANNGTNDNNFLSLIYKDGFENAIANEPGNFTSLGYCITPAMIMYPMLFNYYSYNISYMGQQVSYTSKYVNNVQNLIPINANGGSNPLPLQIKFSANYPNLTLNVYATDTIIGSNNTPIGQINLSTALLPNTTNPEATFETNEKKIINNSATLKNLDTASLGTSYLGGLGLNSILNPLSFFANAINVGLDTSKINLNFSNSFGSAKQYQLAHQNVLQTAGDNLGNPDNLLTYGMEIVSLNDLQNIVGQVDKYGYPYNQGDRFSNLFGNYYHNYIKLSQNADLVVHVNGILLLKEWQLYLIQQFTNGVVIGENAMPDGSISFMDTGQLYNDCMNGAGNYGDIQNGDSHYHANFKFNHKANTLISFIPLEESKTSKSLDLTKDNKMDSIITPKKEQNPTNQKEMALNKVRKVIL